MHVMNQNSYLSPYVAKAQHFLLCPLQQETLLKKVAAVVSLFLLTVVTAGLWLIPFFVFGTLQGRVSVADIKNLDERLQQVVRSSPPFNKYKIKFPAGSQYEGTTLSQTSLRPANFFFSKLFENTPITTTLPGSGALFAFQQDPTMIRNYLNSQAEQNPNRVISVSAQGFVGSVKGQHVQMPAIYGDKAFQLSMQEVKGLVDSQKIYVSNLLPLPFYSALKVAMRQDNIVTLPGSDWQPLKLKDVSSTHLRAVLQQAEVNPAQFGFRDRAALEWLKQKTLYQIGSLVVKTENYHVFIDENGKIRERRVGENDAIRLINMCGIRGFSATNDPDNLAIMRGAFTAALTAAESGYVVFPAVGMGVWRGNPDLYWRAFFEAVIQSGGSFKHLFVNPRHQATESGTLRGKMGEEFETILREYLSTYASNPAALAQLKKIVNLYDGQQDVMQLGLNLKKAYPDERVSVVNAGDPDGTFGYQVGQYVNNIDHATTTDENFTAEGTNGLCFEAITGVHLDPSRLYVC